MTMKQGGSLTLIHASHRLFYCLHLTAEHSTLWVKKTAFNVSDRQNQMLLRHLTQKTVKEHYKPMVTPQLVYLIPPSAPPKHFIPPLLSHAAFMANSLFLCFIIAPTCFLLAGHISGCKISLQEQILLRYHSGNSFHRKQVHPLLQFPSTLWGSLSFLKRLHNDKS